MADLREVFPVLADATTNEGVDLTRIQVGDAPATKNGLMAFAWRDSSGNVVLPQLLFDGSVPVTHTDLGTEMQARGTAAGSASDVAVASITLSPNEVYKEFDVVVSCFREAIFYLEQVDDGNNTILADFVVGPGSYTIHAHMKHLAVTAGASGPQQVRIMARNLDKLSDFRGAVTCLEVA